MRPRRSLSRPRLYRLSSRRTLKFGGPSVKATWSSSTAAPTPSRNSRRKLWIAVRVLPGACGSVAGMRLLHRRHLLRRRTALIFGLPGLIGHAVDLLAALVLGERHALLVGGILEPVGEAVAAEAGQIHQ